MEEEEKDYSSRLKDALRDRALGMTLAEASSSNNIPMTNLYRAITSSVVLPKGRPCYLTPELEKELVDTAIYMGSRGFGMTYTKFMEFATDCVNSVRVGKEDNSPLITLSHKWWEGFKSRNPGFGCWKPKGRVNVAKMDAEQNEDAILSFYEAYDNLNLKYNFTPDQVWNADETGSSQKESACYIVGDRKQRTSQSKVGSNALHMTMLACINGTGKISPPLFILKGDEMDGSVLANSLGAMVTNSPSAYINEGIFNQWFHKWIKWIREQTEQRMLLILDNCSSHICYSTISIAKENNIELIALPPNLTHILQPLDVCIFRSFKARIRSTLADTLTFYNTRKLNHSQFIELCCRTIGTTFLTESIIASFKTIGLFPTDPNKAFERLQQGLIFIDTYEEQSEKMDTESKQRLEINELKMEILRLQSKAIISAAMNSVPKRRVRKVKNALAQVLTHSEVQELPVVVPKPRRKSKKQKLTSTEAS